MTFTVAMTNRNDSSPKIKSRATAAMFPNYRGILMQNTRIRIHRTVHQTLLDKNATVYHRGAGISNLCDKMAAAMMHKRGDFYRERSSQIKENGEMKGSGRKEETREE